MFTGRKTSSFLFILITIIVSLNCNNMQALAQTEGLTATDLGYGLDAKSGFNILPNNPVKINELFSQKHPGTQYEPIKLEASMDEPLIIGLEDILAIAVENNINLNIARADSNIAKWQYWSQFSTMLPDFTLKSSIRDLSGTFFLNSNFQNPIDQTISSAGFRVSYRAFSGGTKLFLTLAEKFYRESTNAKEKSAYNTLLLNLTRTYYSLLKSQVALATQIQSLKESQANLLLSKRFFEAGVGTRYDVLQAEARLARTQQNLINEEATFRLTQIALAELLNYPLFTPFVLEEQTIKDMNLIDESLDMREYLKTTFKNNPDITSILKAKEGAVREALSTAGSFLPYVDVYYDKTATGSGFFDNTVTLNTLGLEMNYDFGKGLGATATTNVLVAKANVKRAEFLYAQELQRVEKDLRSAFIEYQRSKSLVEATLKEYLAAEEAVRLARLRYKNGIEIMTNLITVETDLTQAQLELINSTADYNISQATLDYNMGTISVEKLLNRY